jgi:hypothetical protein
MSLRERLEALLLGRVWILFIGNSLPQTLVTTDRSFMIDLNSGNDHRTETAQGEKQP